MVEEDIKVYIRWEERVIRHRWKKHSRGWVLSSALLKKGTQQHAGKALTATVKDDEGLRKKGREHVDAIRERASKRGNQAAAAAAGKGKRKGADAALSDPLAAGTARGGATRSGAAPRDSQHEAVRFGLLLFYDPECVMLYTAAAVHDPMYALRAAGGKRRWYVSMATVKLLSRL